MMSRVGYSTLIYFVLALMEVKCISGNKRTFDKSEYYVLKRQLTPDKKYYIYEYARGGAAFTGDITGIRLLDINERFTENAGKAFPYRVEGWLSKDTLLVNSVTKASVDADTFPVRIDYEKFENYVIKKVSYKSTVQGGGLSIYTFDSLSASEGRLKVFGLNNKSVSSLVFLLGPITVYKRGDWIEKVEVEGINKYYDAANKAMITSELYELTPTNNIPVGYLGKVGIFYSIK